MKEFELTIYRRDGDKIAFFEKIEADDLVELLSKQLLLIVKLQTQLLEEAVKRYERHEGNDDIPF
jgi:hypothetical protein